MQRFVEHVRHIWREHFRWVSAALLAALTLFCYGFALGLPFFHDDLPIMTWLQQHGWRDIWFSQENGYYRPLAFTVYKIGTWLPLGPRQVALHAVNVALLWASAVLLSLIAYRSTRERERALLAGVLLVVFPFLIEGIPWITALSHPLVLTLTLLATHAALRADETGSSTWWTVSLTATALAPLAHESGAVTGVIVGGFWLLTRGFQPNAGRRIALAGAGVLFNVVAVLSRAFIPGAHTLAQMQGLQDLPQNAMYFLQGLLYPIAPLVQLLVSTQGWHDFTLLGLAALPVAALVLLLIRKSRDGRWALGSLWWWACGALPAAASLRYGGLFVGARLYTLASAGIVLFWAGVIVEVARSVRPQLVGRLLAGLMALTLLAQNVTYLRRARTLYDLLDAVYAQVLAAAEDETHAPLGFVNVPSSLIWEERAYPLVTGNVVFVPDEYTNILEFIQVNVGWREAHAATYGPLYVQTDPTWLGQGPWLEGESLREFVVKHRTLWLGRYDVREARFTLDRVGHVAADNESQAVTPAVRFENGPTLLSADVHAQGGGRWQIALEWAAAGPAEATVFVHVTDQNGALVAQADGAALGGLFPLQLWQRGDRVRDLRYVTVPADGIGPYTVQVGLYDDAGRLPALVKGERAPDDAPIVATFSP